MIFEIVRMFVESVRMFVEFVRMFCNTVRMFGKSVRIRLSYQADTLITTQDYIKQSKKPTILLISQCISLFFTLLQQTFLT